MVSLSVLIVCSIISATYFAQSCCARDRTFSLSLFEVVDSGGIQVLPLVSMDFSRVSVAEKEDDRLPMTSLIPYRIQVSEAVHLPPLRDPFFPLLPSSLFPPGGGSSKVVWGDLIDSPSASRTLPTTPDLDLLWRAWAWFANIISLDERSFCFLSFPPSSRDRAPD